jgi:hypothetical protein
MIDPGAIASWRALAAQVRASQPAWSSPLITTTGMLEQRFRFDASQHMLATAPTPPSSTAAAGWI